jgi:hypothetical protein
MFLFCTVPVLLVATSEPSIKWKVGLRSRRKISRNVELTTHLHLVPRLMIRGAVLPLSIHVHDAIQNVSYALVIRYFSSPNPYSRTKSLRLTAVNRNEYRRPELKSDNLTAICERIVLKLCEPRRLTTLWASTACYRNSCNFFFSDTLYHLL